MTKIVECLSQTINLNTIIEDALQKMGILENHLEQFRSNDAKEEIQNRTLYENIDDIVNLEGSVAGHSCHDKRRAVQAIRRKLEMLSLMKDMESNLFEWPWPPARSKRVKPRKEGKFPHDDEPMTDTDEPYAGETDKLRCLISQSIKWHKNG
ncbi:uncharacterized protein LOC124460656 [Drosophila willistoni]|uniref:uncharacterized protein LOC124460656 n=1 Tax=Drosophila willistoni TaxID=7260 RepID=UPI001F07F85C|nr:uncharacterized protein LOC124460656 [Drosophila willistoni]